MKKLNLIVFFFFSMFITIAQTEKGTWQMEVGTTPFGENTIKQGNSTGFNLLSTDGSTLFSIGGEGGYFIADNSAVKFGLAYTDLDFTNYFTYKLGFKQYFNGNVPVQLDITGAIIEDDEDSFTGETVDNPDPLWLGLQVGYAAFFGQNVALEPTLRHNFSLNQDFSEADIFEMRLNFVIFF